MCAAMASDPGTTCFFLAPPSFKCLSERRPKIPRMDVNKMRIETDRFGPVASCRLREVLRDHHLSCDLTAWLKISEPASASLENAYAQFGNHPK
jgi:hypothetical protein